MWIPWAWPPKSNVVNLIPPIVSSSDAIKNITKSYKYQFLFILISCIFYEEGNCLQTMHNITFSQSVQTRNV